MLAIDVAGGVVVEDEHQAGEAGQRGGAQMSEVGDAGHLNFDGHRDLALDLFGGAAGPLGDDLDVVVGDVRIGFDGQSCGRTTPQAVSTHDSRRGRSQRFLSAKSTECANASYWFPAVSSRSALVTTCWPG